MRDTVDPEDMAQVVTLVDHPVLLAVGRPEILELPNKRLADPFWRNG